MEVHIRGWEGLGGQYANKGGDEWGEGWHSIFNVVYKLRGPMNWIGEQGGSLVSLFLVRNKTHVTSKYNVKRHIGQ